MTDDGARSPWAESPADAARAQAQHALDACEDVPRSTKVAQARAYRVHLVIERALVERRSVSSQVRPARAARLRAASDEAPREAALPDPWGVDIHVPLAWRAARREHRLDERASTRVCAACGANGLEPCRFCAAERVARACANCGGLREVPCSACGGGGRVQITPVVAVEVGVETTCRVVEAAALPRGLARAIEGVSLAGPVIFTERGPSLTPSAVREGGPYRGESRVRVSEKVDAVIDAMLTHASDGSDVDPSMRARVHAREVEVREVVLYVAALESGRIAYVCGSPAHVLPKGVCDPPPGLWGTLRRLFRRDA